MVSDTNYYFDFLTLTIGIFYCLKHSGYGTGIGNAEGITLLDMCATTNLAVANSFFRKDINKLVTFSSSGSKTQTD